jgi:hypothetical protein
MDIAAQRRCLNAIAGGLWLCTCGAAAWSLRAIDAGNPGLMSQLRQAAPPRGVEPIRSRAIEPAVLARSLRGPLYDPPPDTPSPVPQPRPVPPAPPTRPDLDVTLVGTIIEAERSLAILADPSGKFDIKTVGQSLELSPAGIIVESIEAERVTLRYQGRQTTVQLDRQSKGTENVPKRLRERGRER